MMARIGKAAAPEKAETLDRSTFRCPTSRGNYLSVTVTRPLQPYFKCFKAILLPPDQLALPISGQSTCHTTFPASLPPSVSQTSPLHTSPFHAHRFSARILKGPSPSPSLLNYRKPSGIGSTQSLAIVWCRNPLHSLKLPMPSLEARHLQMRQSAHHTTH